MRPAIASASHWPGLARTFVLICMTLKSNMALASQMRVLGRWMRTVTIPNQSSVAKAFHEFHEFHEAGQMKPSSFYDRVVDVMEEWMKFTLLTRGVSPYLVERYTASAKKARRS